jgi:hypothetical protein
VGRRTVQDWESGFNCPAAERLQAVIVALLDAGVLTPAREMAHAHALWAAVERDASRMRTSFDRAWLARLLSRRPRPADRPAPPRGTARPGLP